MNEPSHFGLFAGQGGFELAYESEGFHTIGISEIDPHANIITAHWFNAPNFGDIDAPDFCDRILDQCPPIDVLTGGVPCQPASLLGKRLGQSDERWHWPRTIEVTRRLRPCYAHFENPPAILTVDGGSAFNGIVCGLAEIGYDCFWQIVPAAIFGAGHLRQRLFIIAADSQGGETHIGKRGDLADKETVRQGVHSTAGNGSQIQDESSPNPADPRLQGHARLHAEPNPQEQKREIERGHIATPDLRGRTNRPDWWHETHTGIPVLAHGIPSRLVETACRLSGNAVTPQQVAPLARAIRQLLTP